MVSPLMDWNAELYDSKIGYVPQVGKDLTELLRPKSGERILDLGCGTGDVTAQLAGAGAEVMGMDASKAMIDRAKAKYPQIPFFVGDGQHFTVDRPVDAVFSNAALHWMMQADAVASCVYHALKPGGRFVAEFGGKGNNAPFIEAIEQVISQVNTGSAAVEPPWYFPSIAVYMGLLEQTGFTVRFASYFHRPTVLSDGEAGLRNWLDAFCGDYFHGFSQGDKCGLYARIEERLSPTCYRDGSWVADYVRIRFEVWKP